MAKDIWKDNKIQFPRLLAEIVATQDLNMKELCESMDLDAEEVGELFERAEVEWQKIKDKWCPPAY